MEDTMLAIKLVSVQRAVLVSMCGDPRTTLTMTLNSFLHIAPVDTALKCMPAEVALKLRENLTSS